MYAGYVYCRNSSMNSINIINYVTFEAFRTPPFLQKDFSNIYTFLFHSWSIPTIHLQFTINTNLEQNF